ncbi:MAG: LppX_LprAFG lipoprotein [Mycobacterium sp.]
MRNRIRLVLVPLAISLAVASVTLAGCSKSEKADTNLPEAATLLTESAATTKAQKSTHIVLKVTGDKPVLKLSELTGDLTTSPAVAAKGTAKTGGLELPFVVLDGELWAQLSSTYTSMGPVKDVYDIGLILDPNKGLANLLSNIKDAKSEKTETVDGVDSILVDGTMSKDALNTFAGSKLTSDIPAKAWIQKDGTHQLTKISVDTSPGNTIEMSLSDWGKPVTVDKPAS